MHRYGENDDITTPRITSALAAITAIKTFPCDIAIVTLIRP